MEVGVCHVNVLSVLFYGVLSALCFRDCEALWSALHIPVSVAQAAVRSSINQGDEASRIALDEGFLFFNNSISWGTSLTSLQRGTTGVTNTFHSFGSSFPLLASSSWCLHVFFFLFLALAARGLSFVGRVFRVLDGRVRVRASVAHFRWGRFRVFSIIFFTVVLLLGAQLTPVLWQLGYAGVRVGEASHPGGLHLLRPPKFHRVLFPRIRVPSP